MMIPKPIITKNITKNKIGKALFVCKKSTHFSLKISTLRIKERNSISNLLHVFQCLSKLQLSISEKTIHNYANVCYDYHTKMDMVMMEL